MRHDGQPAALGGSRRMSALSRRRGAQGESGLGAQARSAAVPNAVDDGPMNLSEEIAPGASGIDQLRALLASGRGPGIMDSLKFEFVSIEPGRAVFEAEPGLHAYNPIGVIHGGYIATLLDSAAGCAVHSMLDETQAYTTLELKIPTNVQSAPRVVASARSARSPPWDARPRSPRRSSPTPRGACSRRQPRRCWCSRAADAHAFRAVTSSIASSPRAVATRSPREKASRSGTDRVQRRRTSLVRR